MSNESKPATVKGPPKPLAKIRPKDLGNKPLILTNPEHIAKFADVLQAYIVNNNLSTKIGGKDYANVDGWKFAAINFGLAVVCRKPVRLDQGKIVYNLFETYVEIVQDRQVKKERIFYSGTDESVVESLKKKLGDKVSRVMINELYSYECEADIFSLKTGEKVGYGSAICSNAETKKATFDQYAVQAMSQTRAIGRAVKNMLGFIMNAAGFENTPAEEMAEPKYSEQPAKDPEQTARVVPEGGLDFSTQLEIDEKKTLEDLTQFWEKNPDLHNYQVFIDAMNKRKLEIKAGKI